MEGAERQVPKYKSRQLSLNVQPRASTATDVTVNRGGKKCADDNRLASLSMLSEHTEFTLYKYSRLCAFHSLKSRLIEPHLAGFEGIGGVKLYDSLGRIKAIVQWHDAVP